MRKPWMYPSSCRIFAISTLSLLAGKSTRVCLADTPLRMRVSMSEIGSVMFSFPLPGALRDAGDVAFERRLPEAQPAHRELAHVGARSSAQLAPVAEPDLVLRRLGLFGHLCSRSHQFVLKGMPRSCSSLRASSSVFAVVTTDTFIPRALSTFM